MISNINYLPLRVFNSIEDYYLRFRNPYNLQPKRPLAYTLPQADHQKDGWREVVIPTVGENKRRGQLIYDEPNNVVTYEVIDLTEDEIKQRILSQAQGERENAIQVKIKAQVEAQAQAITDDAEALKVKALYPLWEDLEDGHQFTADFKVQDFEGLELKLFRCIQAHAKQSDWNPISVPALFTKIEKTEAGIEIWSQPTGGDGKYPYLNPDTGKPYQVKHYGQTWENTHQGGLNVWEPGVFGWDVKQ